MIHHLYTNFAKAEGAFQLTLLLYALAFLAYLASLWAPALKDSKDRIYQAARLLFLAAFLANAYTFLDRSIAAGRPAIKTFYENLTYFAFLFGAFTLAVEWLRKARLLGALATAIVLSALTFALHKLDVDIVKMPPALNSAWFLPHVSIYIGGYASLTLGFALGIGALLKRGGEQVELGGFLARALGSAELNLEKATISWVRVGWLLLGAGLITGGTWAKFAWSDYWSWDPKENWGLITWLVFGIALHLQYFPGMKKRSTIWASVAGWGFLLFTYFGMGYLPTRAQSMHIYTEPPPADQKDVNGVNKDMY